jgi:alkanesulfonate monooxygenase SsuD/methylene tetrahydromethanopterin reductase-like flavin-dependent oxidoreductase (luciferase family)
VKVGVGLPTSTPGSTRALLTSWARQADHGPFASLGVLDRVAYDILDPVATLGLAAGITERIRLATMILIAPLRNTVLLAKQAATLDLLSGGRFTLGVAVGARGEDYAVAGVEQRRRGARLGEQLSRLKEIWDEGRVGPRPTARGPQLLVGGGSGETFARAARYADGYVHGGGPPRAFAGAASRARAAWRELGRPGEPVLWGMGYFALGETATERGAEYLRHYYAFTGPFAEKIAAGNLVSPGAIVDTVRGYADAGCDELVFFPTVSALEQLDRLADVIGGL